LREKNKEKTILSLCSGTGAWEKPYVENGYNVISISLPSYDVRLYYPPENVYGILAAPPCTHLATSGARWWEEKGQEALLEGLSVVDACLRIILLCKLQGELKFWALENPVGRLVHYLGKPKMYFDPYEYGDPWTKKTCLWGEFNIPKRNPVKSINKNYIHYIGPGPNRQKIRSITPPGFARAFFESNK